MKKRLALLLGLLVLAAGYGFYHHYMRQAAIRGTLAYGRLPPLPPSAREVEVETSGSPFSRTFWLSFQADEPTLRAWLRRCPELQARAPGEPLSYPRAHDAPRWFPPVSGAGTQTFEIPFNRDALYGTVWVDWKTRRVYIQTSHS
jgi:hypothetical protein